MRLHSNIHLLAVHNFFTDFVLFAPVAILYFQKVTGSYALGMSIFSIAYVSSALFEIPTGVISDYIGRKKTLILGSLFSVLCVVFYAIGSSYLILIIGALLQGISIALYSGNNDALLHESLTENNQQEDYHVYLGETSALFQVGLASAAILGSVIAHWSFTWVMWSSVVPQLGALFTSFFIQEPSNAPRASTNVYIHLNDAFSAYLDNAKLRTLSLASVFRFALGDTAYYFRNAFVAMFWPVWAIGVVGLIGHAGAAVSYYFSGKIINKFKPINVLIFETIINRIISFTAILTQTIYSPLMVATTSWMFGVGSVAVNSLMQKEFTARQRATMSSINAFAGSIAFGIFSVTIGAIADHLGIINAMIVNHILLLLLPLFTYFRLLKIIYKQPLQ